MILFSVHGSTWMSAAISDIAKDLAHKGHSVVLACWDERAVKDYLNRGHKNVISMIDLYQRHDYPEPEDEEVKKLLKLDGSVPYPEGGIPGKGDTRRCSQAWASCQFLVDALDPDVFVIWNNLSFGGRLFDMLAKPRAQKFYIERGPIAGTMQLSTCGVNANLRLAREALHPSRDFIDDATELVTSYKSKKLHDAWPEIPESSGSAPEIISSSKKPVFLWISQVALDTQIVYHSDFGYDYGKVYDLLRESWNPDGPYQLVIKMHPAHYLKSAHEKAYAIPGAHVVLEGDVRCYLEHPNVHRVATVNSSVGFEALLYGIPTVTLGRNWYTSMTRIQNELPTFMNEYTEPPLKEIWPAALYRLASGFESGEFVMCNDFPVWRLDFADCCQRPINADKFCSAIERRG